ncbi:50S ribosomal protein L25 [Aerococcus suis]|uniref:Large ribosomal subunit protein bL25 n=1 Tax=Aerococcus suis TaxID=371602 RepID=A0A1W1Y4F5_9LACT|nr:50S ribosomal protein L25 [Aerococcus suis]MCI7240289.1 50S ribosomal protein L25 [Aerococcus suis]MDD7758156.1 50S ribosomal protein L25 [Aerococcus suis]SMC30618.1 large subunit ribosomal protein L25 [Aerococcus suis]
MKFTANKREAAGTNASKQLRKQDLVPGVVYSSDMEPVNITMNRADVDQIKRELGINSVFTLDLDGETKTVFVREIDSAAIKPIVYNISLQAIKKGQKLEMPISITVVNEEELGDADGVAAVNTFEIDVVADPSVAPEVIEIDVTGMHIGDTVTAGDIKLPEGVELNQDAEESIVSITVPDEEPEEDANETEEEAEPEVINEKPGEIVEEDD